MMDQHTVDTLAYAVINTRVQEIAKAAAEKALASVDLDAILDEELPGVVGSTRAQIKESASLVLEGGIRYLGLSDASEVRWERENESSDAMVMKF